MKNDQYLTDFSPIKSLKKPKRIRCPAKCQTTGKCYGKVYFQAKYGKPEKCQPKNCKFGFKKG